MSEEEWDTSKENFVPVKQGRPASALVTPVSVGKRDVELTDAKQAFLQEIEHAEDPLPVWQKYIKWTQEQYSTQASRKELTKVLEAATKALSGNKCYTDDVRLLRIWVQYADCLPDPSDVFLYLEDHGIGRNHALLYEAYAAYLELKGNYSQADLVYQEGINRLAKPLDRLKQKHAAFGQRMTKRRERQESEAALGMGPAATEPSLTRSTLAPLAAVDAAPQLDENGRRIQPPQSRARGFSQSQQQAASVAFGVRPAPVASSSQTGSRATGMWGSLGSSCSSSSSSMPQQRQGASGNLFAPVASMTGSSSSATQKHLQVLVDDEFGPSGQGPVPTAFPPSLQQHTLLPGLAATTKENSVKPAAWAGAKLKQQSLTLAPVSSRLEVYEDEGSDGSETGADDVQQAQQPPQRITGLRKRLDAVSSSVGAPATVDKPATGAAAAGSAFTANAGLLAVQTHPATLHCKTQQPKHSGDVSSSSSTAKGAAAAAHKDAPLGYSEALLLGPDGEELCFEEVRAVAWRRSTATLPRPCVTAESGATAQAVPTLVSASRVSADSQAPSNPCEAPKAFMAAVVSSSSRDSTVLHAPRPNSVTTSASGEPQQSVMRPEAVACHAAAITSSAAVADRPADENSHACAASSNSGPRSQLKRPPLGVSDVPIVTAAEGASTSGYAEGVTINTRAAFDAMNGMFGGDDTTTMHGFGRAAGRKSMAAADIGGVTINTQAAFDAMNGMFGGDDTITMHGFGRAAGRQMGVGVDPTVTVSTRAAMDAMNRMFGSADVTQTTALGVQQGIRRHSTMPAAAAASSSKLAGSAGMSLGVYEDTELIAAMPATQTAAEQDLMLGVYEDTEFVGARTAALQQVNLRAGSSLLGVYEDTDFISHAPGALASSSRQHGEAPVGTGSGLGVYEDTEFISAPTQDNTCSATAAVGGMVRSTGQEVMLGVHEDTEFIARPNSSNGSSCTAAAAAAAAAGPIPKGCNSLGLYEDTEFISGPLVGAMDSRAGGGSSSFGVYEDTEFITQHVMPSGADQQDLAGDSLAVYEDTEFITRPVAQPPISGSIGGTALRSKLDRLSLANEALYRGQAAGRHAGRDAIDARCVIPELDTSSSPGGRHAADADGGASSRDGVRSVHNVRASSKNLTHPASCSSQQVQDSMKPRPHAAVGPPPYGHCVLAGSSGGSSAGSMLHQHAASHAGAGPSRLGPGSVPSSPGLSRPGSASNTPGRPPRTPGTPGTGLHHLVQHMDSFEVMDSPAVHAALEQRPQQPGTTSSSPAGSLASSPGCGARENQPGATDTKAGQLLHPRCISDRASRAAALQPISASRAESLGLILEAAPGGCDDDAPMCAQQPSLLVRPSPGRALRSLHFGHQPSGAQP